MGGVGIIKDGEDTVEIKFDKEMTEVPNINVSLNSVMNRERIYLEKKDKKGFKVKIKNRSNGELIFSWWAYFVR